MIDLGRKPSREQTAPMQAKEPEIYYPSFYVDKDLGLTEDDAGKIIMALCKLKIEEVGKRATEDSKRHTNSFKVMAMEINKKRKGHYAKDAEK